MGLRSVCVARHSLDDTAGYVVVQTVRDGHRVEIAVTELLAANLYGKAVEVARSFRTFDDHRITAYAVIDIVYTCGCRGRL